jgi:hypothetical protein
VERGQDPGPYGNTTRICAVRSPPRARAERAAIERREIADPSERDARFGRRGEISNG